MPNHSVDNAEGIVDPVNATLIGTNPMLVLCPLEKGFCADVMLLGNKAERPLPIRIPVFNAARKSLPFDQPGVDGKIRAIPSGVVYLDCENVLLRTRLKQLKMVLQVDHRRLGCDLMSGVGFDVERGRGSCEVHCAASSDFLTIQVGDESIVVLYMKHQVIHSVRVPNGESVAKID